MGSGNNKSDFTAEFLNSAGGSKIAGKEDKLKKLSMSPEGQKVRSMLEPDSERLKKAVESGNTEELKKTLSGIMSTNEGAKLIKQLSDMFK